MFQFHGDLSQVKFYRNNYGQIFAKLTDGSMIDGVRKFFFSSSSSSFVLTFIDQRINYFLKFLLPFLQCREQQATNDIIIIITVIIIHQNRARVQQQQPSLIMKLVSSKKNKQFDFEEKEI